MLFLISISIQQITNFFKRVIFVYITLQRTRYFSKVSSFPSESTENIGPHQEKGTLIGMCHKFSQAHRLICRASALIFNLRTEKLHHQIVEMKILATSKCSRFYVFRKYFGSDTSIQYSERLIWYAYLMPCSSINFSIAHKF